MNKICQLLLILFSTYAVKAQVVDSVKDTIPKGFSVGKINIKNPKSVLSGYTYDSATDRYIYTNTVDGFTIDYPVILTPKEYENLVLKESIRNYFRVKADAVDGKKQGADATKKDLLPKYYIKSGLFETIFGGNTIDVKPTGSVELDLGMRYTKQDNPSFSTRNRSTTTFDFNQRISLGLTGKIGKLISVNMNYDTLFLFKIYLKLPTIQSTAQVKMLLFKILK
jgi:cell surface protein SprA